MVTRRLTSSTVRAMSIFAAKYRDILRQKPNFSKFMSATLNRTAYTCCPLCSSNESSLYFTTTCVFAHRAVIASCSGQHHPLYFTALDPEMTWLACQSCGHIYTSGYYSDDVMRRIFESVDAFVAVIITVIRTPIRTSL